MAVGATYVNPDPGLYRTTDPDMALGSRLSLNDTLALVCGLRTTSS